MVDVVSAAERVVALPIATTAKESITVVVAMWPPDLCSTWPTFANLWFAVAAVVKFITANGKARLRMPATHVATINLLVVPLHVSHSVGNGDQDHCCMDSSATCMDNDYAKAAVTQAVLVAAGFSTTVAAADAIQATWGIHPVEQDAQPAIQHQGWTPTLAFQLRKA